MYERVAVQILLLSLEFRIHNKSWIWNHRSYSKQQVVLDHLLALLFFILVSFVEFKTCICSISKFLTFQIFLLTNSLKIHTLHLYDLLTIKCLCLGYKSFTEDDIIAGSFKRCSNVKSVYIKKEIIIQQTNTCSKSSIETLKKE